MDEEIKRLPVPPFRKSIKIKAKKWLRRFLPAELTGTIIALAISYLVFNQTKNLIIAAYAGSIGETAGFYLTIFLQDIIIERRRMKAPDKSISFLVIIHILKNILFDFGIAEILDSLFLRPFCMYIFPLWLINYSLGILAGKFASDIGFYFPVILSYELRIFFTKRRH